MSNGPLSDQEPPDRGILNSKGFEVENTHRIEERRRRKRERKKKEKKTKKKEKSKRKGQEKENKRRKIKNIPPRISIAWNMHQVQAISSKLDSSLR
jgi:hypothetical protein